MIDEVLMELYKYKDSHLKAVSWLRRKFLGVDTKALQTSMLIQQCGSIEEVASAWHSYLAYIRERCDEPERLQQCLKDLEHLVALQWL